MANITDIKTNTFGSLAAVQTITEYYPVLFAANSFLAGIKNTNSFDFMFDLLRSIGVDDQQLLQWASNILTGDENGENGLLSTIETVVKNVLKLNIKNTLSCSVNPFISDDLLDEHMPKYSNGSLVGDFLSQGNGIEIDLGTIDILGTLRTPPTSEIGKFYYFDNDFSNINNLWQTRDFNGFLWYVVNKGIYQEPNEKVKMVWDNRNRLPLDIWRDNIKKTDFLFAGHPNNVTIKDYNLTNKPHKKEIFQCRFTEKNYPRNNKLIVQLSSDTYYKQRKIVGNIYVNKTIFEFNNDFIDSLKLYDSKVLMAQLINNLTGSLSVSLNYSVNELIIKGKVDKIVKNIIETADTEINDCFYSFSNSDFDILLQEAELIYAGKFKHSGEVNTAVDVDPQTLLDSLTGITENNTLNERRTIINNTFTEVSVELATDDQISSRDSFGFGKNIIYRMIDGITNSLVGTILSPKVMILLGINAHIIGQELPSSIDEILRSLHNLIVSMVNEIKNVILNELYAFLVQQLQPLLTLFATKLTLENIMMYRRLLKNLLDCITFVSSRGTQPIGYIDHVNYADIIPQEIIPNLSIC